MAGAIDGAISSSDHLIVEAGTGVGKSLAYLTPFIYWAVNEKKKVVISTYTKTLQQQLAGKDLPFLKKALDIDFRFALCLGGENYLCLRRATGASQYGLLNSRKEVREYEEIHSWQSRTETGLKQELSFEPSPEVWTRVCRIGDLCMGNRCPFRDDCYYNRARKLQNKSHICNHHLYFANLAAGGKALPAFDAVVFDEAHNIEDVATSYLGIEISNFKIKFLCDGLLNPRTDKGLLARLSKPMGKRRNLLENRVNEVRTAATNFFSNLAAVFGDKAITRRIRKPNFIYNSLKEPLSGLSSALKDLADEFEEDKEERIEVLAFASRSNEINRGLEAIIRQSLEEYVYWIEVVKKPRYSKYTLHAAPINVADELRSHVFDQIRPVILTSATLATNGSFDYIKGRLGLEDCRELLLSSPFKYQDNVILYTSYDLPDPSTELDKYESSLIKEIEKILSISRGGTFVLFTSFKMLNKAYEQLKGQLSERLLKQGDMPRYKLIEEFKQNGSSILLGTNTFWQGIDVPGKSLQGVIITKLPFAVPNDPIHEARMELLQSQNIEPFTHYQVPQAIIMLKQGFGRLIRTKRDKGMIAILDPRVKTRFYGKWFLDSLPLCKQITALKEVREFFLQIEGKKKPLKTTD